VVEVGDTPGVALRDPRPAILDARAGDTYGAVGVGVIVVT
jgi:hypothetical protein